MKEPEKFYKTGIPKGHPFEDFLDNLPYNPACDPNPDFIENGSGTRFIAAFNSENCSARMNVFRELFNRAKPCATVLQSRTQANSGLIILMLWEHKPFVPKQTVLALPERWEPTEDAGAPPETPKPKVILPGIKLMPSY